MALPLSNNFDGGTQGSALSAGLTGGASGDAMQVFNATIPTFDNTHSHLSSGFSTLVTVSGAAGWNATAVGTVQDLYGRIYVWMAAAPTGITSIGRCLTPTSTTAGQYSIRIATTGKLTNLVKAGTAITSTTVLPTGQWNRVEFHAHNVVSGTCTLDCNIYTTADSTVITETMTQATGTGVSTDTSINQFFIGSTNTVGTNVWLDDVQINGTNLPGPIIAHPPYTWHGVSQAVNRASTY